MIRTCRACGLCTRLNEIIKSEDYFNLRVNLMTSSVLIKGKDIRNLLPKIVPGKQLSIKMFNYSANPLISLSFVLLIIIAFNYGSYKLTSVLIIKP